VSSSVRRIPDHQRDMIRRRHDAELAALAVQAAAAERLAAAKARRVEVVAEQDQVVTVAGGELMDANRVLIDLIGLEAVAELIGVSVSALRKELKSQVEPEGRL
jgi:hypothetical protein